MRDRVARPSISRPALSVSLLALLGATAGACIFVEDGSPREQPQPGGSGEGLPPPAGGGSIPGLSAAWAVHDGEKIERDDLASPYEAENRAWEQGKVKLFGARNEVIAFQIVAEADDAGIEGLSIALPELSHEDGSAITYAPPGEDPTEYAGRPIQIFVENYLEVAEPSQAWWVFEANSPAAPADPTGWKPVQLVPENATAGRGGLPVDVQPRTNQAFWIEIYTGRDLPAGTYTGSVELRAGGRERRIPVELELHDFTLPDEGSMNAMLYFEPDQVVRYQGRDLQDRYHRFAHRHRVELVHGYDAASLTAAAGRFDGSDFTPAEGYEGPGEGAGNRLAPASFYGVGEEYLDAATAQASADAWMSLVEAQVPGALTFLYTMDEPGPADYSTILQIAENVRSSQGPGKDMPLFVTSGYAPGLEGAIDIWCAPAVNFNVARAAEQHAAGKRYWFYNGTRPFTGALTIDSPATDARANLWAAFKHEVDVYFYWHTDHWRHNGQKVGERDQNVWVNPVTFDNRGQPNKPPHDQGFINGDGVLLYPGEDVLHPEEDRGIAGPIASIQFANLRRGMQDHLYLSMARELGLHAEVEAALAAVVPYVFSEADAAVGFAEHGDAYEEARHALAEAIAAAQPGKGQSMKP